MKLNDLTYLILEFNSLIDRDLHENISMDEVKSRIEQGSLFDWLREQFKGEIDLSLYDPEKTGEITGKLNDILGGYAGSERRKWGVENNGICLLLAWTNELIQRREWS